MPTYLYIHKARTESPLHRFRSEYELRAMDYELRREVGSKGEIISDIAGGNIRAVIDVFGDDTEEMPLEKVNFTDAACIGMDITYSQKGKGYIATKLTLQTRKIAVGTTELNNHWTGYND